MYHQAVYQENYGYHPRQFLNANDYNSNWRNEPQNDNPYIPAVHWNQPIHYGAINYHQVQTPGEHFQRAHQKPQHRSNITSHRRQSVASPDSGYQQSTASAIVDPPTTVDVDGNSNFQGPWGNWTAPHSFEDCSSDYSSDVSPTSTPVSWLEQQPEQDHEERVANGTSCWPLPKKNEVNSEEGINKFILQTLRNVNKILRGKVPVGVSEDFSFDYPLVDISRDELYAQSNELKSSFVQYVKVNNVYKVTEEQIDMVLSDDYLNLVG